MLDEPLAGTDRPHIVIVVPVVVVHVAVVRVHTPRGTRKRQHTLLAHTLNAA